MGEKIFDAVEVSFGKTPRIRRSGGFTFFAGARSDAFFFDFDGIKNLFDISGTRNFTAPHLAELGGKSPWTGQDSNTSQRVLHGAGAADHIWAPIPTSASGAAAVCATTESSTMSTAPATPR